MKLRHLSLALPVLALAAALATTRGEVAFPPLWSVLAIAVGGFAALAAAGGSRPRPLRDLPLMAVVGIAAGHQLLRPGLPFGHDTIQHLWGSWAFYREVLAGDPYPRWLHGLGLGMPLLEFYGPAPFYAVLPFAALGLAWPRALAAAFVAFGALAAMAMYHVVCRWTGERRAGLVAGLAYAFAPYRLLDANYRMALGETAAMAVLPLVLFGAATAMRHGGRRHIAGTGLAVAVLIVTHPSTAVTATVGVGAWLLGEVAVAPTARWVRLGTALRRVGAAWLLAGALAAFYVVPFVAEARFTRLATFAAPGAALIASRHALDPLELIERRQWSGLAESVPRGAPNRAETPRMQLYFGAVLLALMMVAATTTRRRGAAGAVEGEGPGRLPAGLLLATAVTLALALYPIAGWAERLLPPLANLQFAWRFLAVATAGAAAAAGYAALGLQRALPQRWAAVVVPGALALLLTVDAAPFTGAADRLPPWEGLAHLRYRSGCAGEPGCWEATTLPPPHPLRVAGFFLPPPRVEPAVGLLWSAYPEYLTPAAYDSFVSARRPRHLAMAGAGALALPDRPLRRLQAAAYARWRPAGGGLSERRDWSRGGGSIVVRHDGRPGRVEVLEQYFPGWQVLTPVGWREVRPTAAGLLQAAAGGQHEIRFRFTERRWDRVAGWGLSLAAFLLTLALLQRTPRGRVAAAAERPATHTGP